MDTDLNLALEQGWILTSTLLQSWDGLNLASEQGRILIQHCSGAGTDSSPTSTDPTPDLGRILCISDLAISLRISQIIKDNIKIEER